MHQNLKGKEFWGYVEKASVLIALTPDDKILVQNKKNKQYFISKFSFLNLYTLPIVVDSKPVYDTIPKEKRIFPYKEFQELIPNLVETIFIIFNINRNKYM